MNGYLGLILCCHVPYLRSAGREPNGEEALHETIAQAIIPTLNTLFDLRDTGLRPRIGLAYSPVLLEQLNDNVVQKHFVVWMERWLARVEQHFAHWQADGEAHYAYLARFYLDWAEGVLRSFVGRYSRNPVAALRELCADGVIEPLASAATHAYLPLLEQPASLQAQVDIGIFNCTRYLGRRPRGFWLPECGYTPAIDGPLLTSGVRYMVLDPSSLPEVPGITHLRPRWMRPRRLAFFTRDEMAMQQIWSPDLGYLDDPLYRAPRRDPRSGLALWRNGDGEQHLYDPYHAFLRAQEHATHWIDYLAAEVTTFGARHDRPGVAIVPLDAELIGRRWFEGAAWLRALLENIAESSNLALMAPAAYLRAYRPRQGAIPHDGSWGQSGDHHDWGARASLPLWEALGESAERLAVLIRRYPHAHGERERLLAQAVRELLLAQSSDWSLLLNQGAGDEALRRPTVHLRRCEQLCALVEQDALGEEDRALLEQIEEEDNPFPYLNYRVFAEA